MTLNAINKDIIEQRREMVSQLRLRGLSTREIAKALANGNPPLLNPETGKPFGHVTIAGDLKALKLEWAERRAANMDEHIDREFMEIQEIKRAGWSAKDPELALKGLDREMKLLGTAKDKDGLTINIYLGVVQQIISLAEARGDDPMVIFEGVARRLQRANS